MLFVMLVACWMVVLELRPFEIVKDGDLLCLVDRMLQLRGLDTVKISKG